MQHSGTWLLSLKQPISMSHFLFLLFYLFPSSFSSNITASPPFCSWRLQETQSAGAGLQGYNPKALDAEKGRGEPAHMQNYNASISHTDIIPVFYLSPCNSFYILGLCSLAFIQSQPRDTGLYQAHMCALLHLTHISSFVTVTKLARLSWEMCRLWLTVHVWILYFESRTALSNTGSVKASLSLLSRRETAESCSRFETLTACLVSEHFTFEVENHYYLSRRCPAALISPKYPQKACVRLVSFVARWKNN